MRECAGIPKEEPTEGAGGGGLRLKGEGRPSQRMGDLVQSYGEDSPTPRIE